jgi:hypothetical protein
VLNCEKRLTDSDEAHDLRDKVTRKLVEVAREGVIDLETLWERTLAEITRS